MNVTNQDHLAPLLRFPEFIQPWTSGNLGSLIDSLDAGVSVNSVDRPAKKEEKGILKTSCVTLGNFAPYENKAVIDEFELSRLKEPVIAATVIISRMNTPALVGANAFIAEDYPNLYLPDRLWAAKINRSHDSSWVGFLLSSSIIRAYFSKRATGTSDSMKNITKQDVLTVPCSVPKKDEQRKIAKFLGAVDEKLERLRRKRELLAEYKRGVMQQIFSQQIRFVGEGERPFADWQSKKLGEVASFRKGKGIAKQDVVENGMVPCIRYGELYTDYQEVITQIKSFTNVDLAGMVLSKVNDVIIPASGEDRLDMAHASCVQIPGVILGGDLNIISGAFNGIFLAYYMNSAKRYDIAQVAQGNSVVHLYSSQLAALDIDLPSIDEQQKIANFLTAIDTKIAAVDQQIKQMET